MTNEKNNEQWELLVLLLKHLAKEKGYTQDDIAEKTGLIRSNISRVFSLRYCPRLDIFIKIAKAIDVNFFFEDKKGNSDLTKAFEKAMTELGRRPDNLPKN